MIRYVLVSQDILDQLNRLILDMMAGPKLSQDEPSPRQRTPNFKGTPADPIRSKVRNLNKRRGAGKIRPAKDGRPLRSPLWYTPPQESEEFLTIRARQVKYLLLHGYTAEQLAPMFHTRLDVIERVRDGQSFTDVNPAPCVPWLENGTAPVPVAGDKTPIAEIAKDWSEAEETNMSRWCEKHYKGYGYKNAAAMRRRIYVYFQKKD